MTDLKLYRIFEDNDCHRYLIPKESWKKFIIEIKGLDEEDWYQILEDYDRLEGEDYYIVLSKDVE